MTLEEKIDEIDFRLKNEARIIANWDYHEAFHLACGDEVKLDGLWMEFGVFTGRSLEQFSRKCPSVLYGFDSFEGLHEKWDDNNPKGVFNLNGKIPPGYIVGENHSMHDSSLPLNWKPWPKNVKLVKGFFDKTLPVFLEKFEGDAALIHIDCDLYSSTKDIFKYLKNRIKTGTIIVFDEITDYTDFRLHEIKAFAEFLLETGFSYKPLIYQNLGCSQGCFEIL
jgi:hypothetical protein